MSRSFCPRQSARRTKGNSWFEVLRLFQRRTWWRRFGELRRVAGGVQLNGAKLNDRPTVRPRRGQLKGHLDSRDVAVIRIVDLRGIPAHLRARLWHTAHNTSPLRVQ